MIRRRINIIRRIILITSFLCFLTATAYLLFHFIEQQKHNNAINDIRETAYLPDANEADLFDEQKDLPISDEENKQVQKKIKAVIDFQKLTGINKDVCAWLKIPGTHIDYPVLYHDGDNEFYLHKDINRKYSSYGSLFFAQGCIPMKQDTSLLIYGHHMKDGSMFAGLMQYKQKNYYTKHPYIHLYTPEYNYQYQIASVILTDISAENTNALYCDDYIDMSDPATLQEFTKQITKRQLYNTGVSLTPGDQLLMLSTCEYSSKNGRMIVIARQSAIKECR